MKNTFRNTTITLFTLWAFLAGAVSAASLNEMAEQGDSDAQVLLGYQYLSGTSDSEPSMEKAKYWMRKAAEQGDADAQGVLGTLYYSEKNYSAATPWLTQACAQDNQQACLILAKIPKSQ
ncbi:sel1 repeat family protein [Providencia rettgeri]